MRPSVTTAVLGAAAVLLTACGGPTQTSADGSLAQPMTRPATTTSGPSDRPDPSVSSSPPPPPTTTSTTAKTATPPQCVAADMTGEFGPATNAGYSRTMLMSIVATNHSDHTCTVNGYGGLAMHTVDGAELPTNLTRETVPAQALITLKPGAKAYKKVAWVPPRDSRNTDGCAQGAAYAVVTMPDDDKTFEATPKSDDVFAYCGDIKGYVWTATDLTATG